MSALYNHAIFTYEWHCKKTGWDYRLVFTRITPSQLKPPEYYSDLPEGCIVDYEFEEGFDGFPYGIGKVPILDIEFNLKLTPTASEAEYKDFTSLILYPFATDEDWTFEYDMPCTSYSYLAHKIEEPMQSSVNVKFYIKFNGNDDTSPAIWRLRFNGVQTNDSSKGIDLKTGKYKVTYESVVTYAMRCFKTQWFDYLHIDILNKLTPNSWFNINRRYTKVYYDTIWSEMGADGHDTHLSNLCMPAGTDSKANQTDYNYFWAMITELDSYIQSIMDLLIWQLGYIYTDFQTDSFKFPTQSYLYQEYQNRGNLGYDIPRNSLRIIDLIFYTEAWNTNNIKSKLSEKLSNWKNLFDLYQDLYKQNLYNRYINYDNSDIQTKYLLPETSEIKIVNFETDLINITEITPRANQLKNIEASIQDKTANDIDKIEVNLKAATRTKESETIPIIFNNIPVCYSSNRFTRTASDDTNDSYNGLSEMKRESGPDGRTYYFYSTFDNHLLGLFVNVLPTCPYTSDDMTTNADGIVLKVHEWMGLILNSNWVSEDLINTAVIDIHTAYTINPNDNVKQRLIQTGSGSANVAAKTFYQIFSRQKSCKIKGTAYLKSLTQLQSNNTGFIWMESGIWALDIPIDELGFKNRLAIFQNFHHLFRLTNVKINFSKATVEFEALSIPDDDEIATIPKI